MCARLFVAFCLVFALDPGVSPSVAGWLDGSLPPAEVRAVIALLADAAAQGLVPERFHATARVRGWRDPLTRRDPVRRAGFERRLEDAVVRYVTYLSGPHPTIAAAAEEGLVNSGAMNPDSLVAAIRDRGTGMAAALAELAPRDPAYQRLCAALADLRAAAAAGGWPRIGEGPTMHPGDVDPRVPVLRRRLDAAPTDDPDSLRYDADLAVAVMRFQARHGLAADGVIGRRTVAALDVPAAARARQAALNLERLRWLPKELGERHVIVNVPAGTLTMVANDSVHGVMRAVVGRPDRPTPTLASRITRLELNPAWNIPHKLAREDVLPHVHEDPTYLQQQGIRVFASWRDDAPEIDPATIDWTAVGKQNFAYKLRQDPGPLNPLGRVKFLFDNPYSVYIHDTPSRNRFAMPARFYSSGCVRIENPAALARFLVAEGEPAARDRLENALASAGPGQVRLPRSVPVYLVYWTAWVDPDGVVQFRDDVYGHDATLAAALYAPTAGPWSPVADRTGVDVDEVRGGVIADAAPLLP